jgi:hypothetical protein
MAAKKAATKSRSSKSNKNKNNLKWWYVLPVIAIVAIAGYAIVRFSEAGTAEKRVGSGLNGGNGAVNKGNAGTGLNVTSRPARGSWSYAQRGTNTRFCVEFFGANGDGPGNITLRLTRGIGGITILDPQTTPRRGISTVCTRSLTNAERFKLNTGTATLYASNAGGTIQVIRMYATQ